MFSTPVSQTDEFSRLLKSNFFAHHKKLSKFWKYDSELFEEMMFANKCNIPSTGRFLNIGRLKSRPRSIFHYAFSLFCRSMQCSMIAKPEKKLNKPDMTRQRGFHLAQMPVCYYLDRMIPKKKKYQPRIVRHIRAMCECP